MAEQIESESDDTRYREFSKVLQKIVTASNASAHAAIEAAKATKPSRHTRFVYDPAKGHESSR